MQGARKKNDRRVYPKQGNVAERIKSHFKSPNSPLI